MKVKVWAHYHPAASLHQPRLLATLLEDWANKPNPVPSDFEFTDKLPPLGSKVALDTETDNAGGIGRWSIAWRDTTGKLLVHTFYGAQKQFPTDKYIIIGHNLKYDNRELIANGMKAPKPDRQLDTMIEAYCRGLGRQAPKEDGKTSSGSDMVGGLGLKYLARRWLDMRMNTWLEVRDNPEIQVEYNAKDSIATYLLDELWTPTMPKHFFDIDMPLLPVLMKMEDRGIYVDQAVLLGLGKEIDNELAGVDLPINPFSPPQLQSLLYGVLELEPWKFTDTGAPSVDDEVLEVIDNPLVQQILSYKRLAKERGTYVENYLKARGEDGRIHPEIKQTSTSTGRLSVARPALQNVFKRDDRVKLRAFLAAPPGFKIIRCDFNQLDFRTLTAITQDKILLAALNANKKIHQVTADELGISYDVAKTMNFGTMFGQEAWALSGALHITIGEAREFLKHYFERFPGIKKYKDDMTEIIKRDKKVTIPFTGRVRRIDAMYVENWKINQEGIREGISTPVQGLEGEVVKTVMIDLDQKHNAPMVMQIHDEVLFEVEDKIALDYAHWLNEYIPTICHFGGMNYPVETGIGNNWYEAMKNVI